MTKTTKAIVAAAFAVAVSGGVAAAATGSLPTQADNGLTNATNHTGIVLPASHDNHPTASNHPGGGSDASTDSSDSTESSDASSSSQPDNHGAAVSDVAQNTTATGEAKGDAVSAVAQDNTGLTNHAAPQAALGAGNAGDHGKP